MGVKNKIDLGMTGYDELFMDDKTREENRLPKIYGIPLSEIDEFPDHPFHVRDDEDMVNLVESIKERGVITPITLRPKEDGRYEIVSGHRRARACELAGLDTVKAEIREMSLDEAILLMVDSNLQRSTILPSEKAFAYKMKLDAMKRLPGRPPKNNLVPVGQNYSREELAEQIGESQTQIQRYIRLTNLAPELLDMVDEGKIAMRPAVEISYLPEEHQECLINEILYNESTPSLAQAIKMKNYSKEGKLSPEIIEVIMSEEKPNQKEKYSFSAETIKRYIPQNLSREKTEEYVIKALEFYQRHLERQRNDAR